MIKVQHRRRVGVRRNLRRKFAVRVQRPRYGGEMCMYADDEEDM